MIGNAIDGLPRRPTVPHEWINRLLEDVLSRPHWPPESDPNCDDSLRRNVAEWPLLADVVEKVFLERRAKLFGAADAFPSRGQSDHIV